ncbi:FtsX-like permease family protein [Asanoa hainanensis]|uniref:FtsX-like permease family protein n=1 Tax=Asanoa hainanensis TaxID=560556 RepID=A0A239JTC3_9ACTN|nr:FtsX-like permease family protein [Asanoa hainanensis]SNT08084.1 FtsX-like permease family protein [Asanoa hainanensis]
MSGLIVTLRGIRSRFGRSTLVVLLSTVAIAAAVLVPLYSRAAAQSVLTDTVAAPPPIVAGLTARSTELEDMSTKVDDRLKATPIVASVLGSPQDTIADSVDPAIKQKSRGRIVFRPGACEHLTIVEGRCPGANELMISDRTVERIDVHLGDLVKLPATGGSSRTTLGAPPPVNPSFPVVGIYRIGDPTDPYWETTGFFGGSEFNEYGDGTKIVDELFTGTESTVLSIPLGRPVASIEYPLVPEKVRLGDVPELLRELNALSAANSIEDVAFNIGLLDSLRNADRQRSAITAAVPTVALPLVLLCWFVLFLVVAAVTDDRRAEIAVGKLRGLSLGGITRFAVGEPLLLIALAAPLGLLLGIGLTNLAAGAFLAPGVDVQIGWPALLVGLGALFGAVAAAVLGARETVRANIGALLRRVPHRSKRSALVVEAIVAALALAALYQLLVGSEGQSATLGYAAPALIALLAGLLTARLLGLVARRRLPRAIRRGRLPALLAAAQVGRRPESARLVAVLTVALALLTFAATIWDVSSANRLRTANAEIGADRVYVVNATEPNQVRAAVERIDPSGKLAMAVTRVKQSYNLDYVDLIGLDTERMLAVSRWPDKSAAQVAEVAKSLDDASAPTVQLKTGRVEVRATVRALQQQRPMSLGMVVGEPGAPPRSIYLGPLKSGSATYAGDLTCAPAGCRLLGLQVRRYPGDNAPGAATVTIESLELGGTPLDAALSVPGAWRPTEPLPATQTMDISTDDSGLTLDVTGASSMDIVAQYGDVAAQAPVVLAGPAPADDPEAGSFTFPLLGKAPDPVHVVDHVDLVPRGGDHALLFDGPAMVDRAERSAGLNTDQMTFEVWATDAAPADLGARLAAEGIPVVRTENWSQQMTQLGRAAPALALRLYLFSGLVALLLALLALVLDAGITAPWRREQARGLRLTGVPARALRGMANRENLMVLGYPVVAGIVAGVGGAALVLPAIALVSIDGGDQAYRLGGWWLLGSLLFLLVALVGAGLVLRRVRGGAR